MMSGRTYIGRTVHSKEWITGPGRIDKACCLIGEKVENIGWRWYEVDIDTFRPLKEGEEPNDK